LTDDNNTIEEMNLYTERSTNLIYETKLFETFVMVRPVCPAFHAAVRKIDLDEFGREFDDFYGDRREVYDILRSMAALDTIETIPSEEGNRD